MGRTVHRQLQRQAALPPRLCRRHCTFSHCSVQRMTTAIKAGQRDKVFHAPRFVAGEKPCVDSGSVSRVPRLKVGTNESVQVKLGEQIRQLRRCQKVTID